MQRRVSVCCQLDDCVGGREERENMVYTFTECNNPARAINESESRCNDVQCEILFSSLIQWKICFSILDVISLSLCWFMAFSSTLDCLTTPRCQSIVTDEVELELRRHELLNLTGAQPALQEWNEISRRCAGTSRAHRYIPRNKTDD